METISNIAQCVRYVFNRCESHTGKGVSVDGIIHKFVFDPDAIAEHRDEIREILRDMPKEFHKGTGDGMSFLRLCVDKDGNQWGEHPDMELLVALGIASGMAKYLLPRDMWGALPGGMPYVAIDIAA